jgi:hypothetical protein
LPEWIVRLMLQKPLEYWAVLIAMVLWTSARDAEREPLMRRVAKTIASAFLTYGLTPSLAPYMRNNELFAIVAIMALGLIVLDVSTALIGDREFIKRLITRKLGGDGDNGDA